MPPTSSKSDLTKAQIMRAAVHLFTERGFAGTSLRDIANEAGQNMGLIRYHFGSKGDLYRDSLAHLSEPYNAACLAALREVAESASPERIIYAWLAAPYTHWESSALISGEELLCFLNKMGYESPELTHDVYESHYSYALAEWQVVLAACFPSIARGDWYWWLSCLRGMYFNIVTHNDFTLWALPNIPSKEPALERLAYDAAQMLRSYEPAQA